MILTKGDTRACSRCGIELIEKFIYEILACKSPV
jgi:hypothetical protein